MSTCNSRTYPLTDPAALAAKIAAAGGPQIDPTQSTGRASSHSVTLAWSITPGTITIEIVAKPWVIPCGAVYEHLDALFGEASA